MLSAMQSIWHIESAYYLFSNSYTSNKKIIFLWTYGPCSYTILSGNWADYLFLFCQRVLTSAHFSKSNLKLSSYFSFVPSFHTFAIRIAQSTFDYIHSFFS